MAVPKLAGTANVTVNGVTYEVAGNFTWSSFTVQREMLKSMSTNAPGFKETPMAAYIEFEGRDMNGTPLSTFQNMVNVTVVAILANGKVLVAQNAFVSDTVAVNSVEATMKLKFECGQVSESSI